MTLRVLLVDDHEMVRAGLRAVLELEEGLEVSGEAGSGEEAVARIELGCPVDVVLLDVVMPGLGGVETCREIMDRRPDVKVLMLTSFADEEAVLSSLMAGASGYLLKNVGRADLARAIRCVAEGKKLLDPGITEKVTRKLVQLMSRSGPDGEEGPLSPRERDILRLVARGCTNRQIAQDLCLAEKTARNYVSKILDKLGLTRRSEAAAWAVKQGLLGD